MARELSLVSRLTSFLGFVGAACSVHAQTPVQNTWDDGGAWQDHGIWYKSLPEATSSNPWGDVNEDGQTNCDDAEEFFWAAAALPGGPDPADPNQVIRTLDLFFEIVFAGTTESPQPESNVPSAGPNCECRVVATQGVFLFTMGYEPSLNELNGLGLPDLPFETCDPLDPIPGDEQPPSDDDLPTPLCSGAAGGVFDEGGACDAGTPTWTDPHGPGDNGPWNFTCVNEAGETIPGDCSAGNPDPNNFLPNPGTTPDPLICLGGDSSELSPDPSSEEIGEWALGGCDPNNGEPIGDVPKEDDEEEIEWTLFGDADDGSDDSEPEPAAPPSDDEEGRSDPDTGGCRKGERDDPDGAGDGAQNTGTTPQPVDLVNGSKRFDPVEDVRVKLPGQDLVISRGQSGGEIVNSMSAGRVGRNWYLGPNMYAVWVPVYRSDGVGIPRHVGDVVYLFGPGNGGLSVFTRDEGSLYFVQAGGTRNARLRSGSLSGLSTLYLDLPGRRTIAFNREPTSALAGSSVTHGPGAAWVLLPTSSYDSHGNTISYEYGVPPGTFDSSEPTAEQVRLTGMRAFRRDPTDPSADLAGNVELARVRFEYLFIHSGAGGTPHPASGMVSRITARQKDDGGNWVETQQVDYTYKRSDQQVAGEELDADGLHRDVGSPGDLVQVRRQILVEDGWDGSVGSQNYGIDFPHKTFVTQYRYHSSRDDFDWAGTDTDERFNIGGSSGLVKAVFEHASIEQATLRYIPTKDFHIPEQATRQFAWELMKTGDASVPSPTLENDDGTPIPAIDLASKIIGYGGGTHRPGEVSVQYLQGAGCGCSGSGAEFTKLEYDYITGEQTSVDIPGVNLGRTWRTTIVDESVPSSSGYTLYRRQYFDYDSFGKGRPVLHYHVVEEFDDAPTPAVKQRWVTEYLYHVAAGRTYQKIAKIPPASMNAVTDVVKASATQPAKYERLTTTEGGADAIVYLRYMNGSNRAEGRGFTTVAALESHLDATKPSGADWNVNLGGYFGTSIPGTLTWKTVYSDGSGDVPSHQPVRFERYPTGVSSTATQSPSDTETTWYEYDYSTEGVLLGYAMLHEAPAGSSAGGGSFVENHPDHGLVTRTAVKFDDHGQKLLMRDPVGLVTEYEYDDTIGRVSSVTIGSDETFTLSGTTETTLTPLVTTIERDIIGRIVGRTSPAGMDGTTAGSVEGRTVWLHRVPAIGAKPDEANLVSPVGLSARLQLPAYADSTFAGPAVLTYFTAMGKPLVRQEFEIDSSATDPYASLTPYNDFVRGAVEAARTIWVYDIHGRLKSVQRWHDVPTGTDLGAAASTTDFDTWAYEYDSVGRRTQTISPEGEISEITEYDAMDRPLLLSRGVDGNMYETARLEYDHLDGTTVQGGNGWLSKTTLYTGEAASGGLSSDERVTLRDYDSRGRVIGVVRPEAPHPVMKYDNLGRVTESAAFAKTATQLSDLPTGGTSTTADRGSFVKYTYDGAGLLHTEERLVDPYNAPSSANVFVPTTTWFDAAHRVKAVYTHHSPMIKMEYDAFGRVLREFVTADGDPGTALSPNVNTSSSEIFEQTGYTYSAAGLLTLVTNLSRSEGSAAGLLGASNAVASFTGLYYDGVNRAVSVVELGSGTTDDMLSTGWTTPSWPPASQPTTGGVGYENALVRTIEYDNRGRQAVAIDPEDTKTRTWYDDRNRVIAVAENHHPGGTGTASSLSDYVTMTDYGYWTFDDVAEFERITSYAYNGDGQVTAIAAHVDQSVPDGAGTSQVDVQVTQYEYDVDSVNPTQADASLPDSLVESRRLVSRVIYPSKTSGLPDSGDATNQVIYSYNRLGELRGVQDRNSTVHEFSRDDAARVTSDRVLAFGSKVSGDSWTRFTVSDFVDEITSEYDLMGRVDRVRSWGDDSGPVVRNAVAFRYTPLGLLEYVDQNVAGDVAYSGATPPVLTAGETVRYHYEQPVYSGTTSGPRLEALGYPQQSRTIEYRYGSGVNDKMGRVEAIRFDGETLNLVEYDYLGLARASRATYPIPDIKLDRAIAPDGSTTSGEYAGLDRHGRIKHQFWADTAIAHSGTGDIPSLPEIFHRAHAYDKSSNMILDRDARLGAKSAFRDRYFHYDDLDRLTEEVKGIWDIANDRFSDTEPGGGTGWQLDILGNWNSLDTYPATSPISTSTLLPTTTAVTDDRSHNALNQLVEDPEASGGTDYAYDYNGNLIGEATSISLPGGGTGLSIGPSFEYDAWNRLVSFSSGSPVAARSGDYEYNGLNWRTHREADLGATIERHDYYYTASWQMIEHRIDSDYDGTDPLDGTHDRIAQQVWGTRYIDDAVARRIDRNADDDYADPSEEPFFYVTDHQFSVRAIVRDTGEVVERVDYTPYGVATHSYENDFNRDGIIDGNDPSHYMSQQPEVNPGVRLLVPTSGTTPDENYYAELDVNRDGEVFDSPSFGDFVPWHNETDGGTLSIPGPPTNWISDHEQHFAAFQQGPDNPIGYTGHAFDPESAMYLARFRHYRPTLGRWIQMDPAGYADGLSLYQYVSSSPIRLVDPFGLFADEEYRMRRRGLSFYDKLSSATSICSVSPGGFDPVVEDDASIADSILGAASGAAREKLGEAIVGPPLSAPLTTPLGQTLEGARLAALAAISLGLEIKKQALRVHRGEATWYEGVGHLFRATGVIATSAIAHRAGGIRAAFGAAVAVDWASLKLVDLLADYATDMPTDAMPMGTFYIITDADGNKKTVGPFSGSKVAGVCECE